MIAPGVRGSGQGAVRALFVCNAGPAVGGGHVMRSLALARALEASGVSCIFAGPAEVGTILDAYGPSEPRLAAATSPQALATATADLGFELAIFDHYGLDAQTQAQIAAGRPCLVIDEMCDRPVFADILVDTTPGRPASAWDGKVRSGAEILTGPRNAPLRPEFAALRDQALARRATGGPARRILVAMGLTDLDAISLEVVRTLLPLRDGLQILIATGARAPSLSALIELARAEPRIEVHVDAPDMASLSASCDLCVGAPGSSAWERCVLGLPSVLVVLAQNQAQAGQNLEEMGAALVMPRLQGAAFAQRLGGLVERLLDDEALRRRLSATSAALCDGRGAERLAERLLALLDARSGGSRSDLT